MPPYSPESMRRVELPESHHSAPREAMRMGDAPGETEIRVSVILRRKQPLELDALRGRHLTRAELASGYGGDESDAAAVRAFARASSLDVDEKASSLTRRRVVLRGTIARFNAAFGVKLGSYRPSAAKDAAPTFHGFTGPVMVPEGLSGRIEAVLGLDNRPIATPKIRIRPNAQDTTGTFTPVEVAEVYDFPTAGNGAGQTIGIIELGGGYTTTDIASYFAGLGIAAPSVIAVVLDGGSNTPGNPSGADGEVMLDIEVAGAVAPGAKIVVYFTTNTDQGFEDAISTAVHDAANDPGVISISWGGPESSWAQTAINSMDSACQSAAALGITITVAAGDSGSSDGASGNNVDFPASSPHVLACGGTALTASDGERTSETVWNDQSAGGGATGGGVSAVFALPTWQANAGVPASPSAGGGRGVPDVSGDASPETGYQTLVDGQKQVVGGTSAVAPLWAGLIVLLNQQLGQRVGFLNPQLYAMGESGFFDITSGSNGSFQAGAGWDACTGLGSPNGAALLAALKSTV